MSNIKGQFTVRLNQEIDPRFQLLKQHFEESGHIIGTHGDMMLLLLEAAEKGINPPQTSAETTIPEGQTLVSIDEYRSLQDFKQKFLKYTDMNLDDVITGNEQAIESLNEQIREKTSELGQYQNGEFMSRDDEELKVVWAMFDRRAAAEVDDNNLKTLIRRIFWLILTPKINSQITGAKETFLSTEYYAPELPAEFKKQYGIRG